MSKLWDRSHVERVAWCGCCVRRLAALASLPELGTRRERRPPAPECARLLLQNCRIAFLIGTRISNLCRCDVLLYYCEKMGHTFTSNLDLNGPFLLDNRIYVSKCLMKSYMRLDSSHSLLINVLQCQVMELLIASHRFDGVADFDSLRVGPVWPGPTVNCESYMCVTVLFAGYSTNLSCFCVGCLGGIVSWISETRPCVFSHVKSSLIFLILFWRALIVNTCNSHFYWWRR